MTHSDGPSHKCSFPFDTSNSVDFYLKDRAFLMTQSYHICVLIGDRFYLEHGTDEDDQEVDS